jgi:autoinducer 2-degrading protein
MENAQTAKRSREPRSRFNILTTLGIVKRWVHLQDDCVLAVIVLIECNPGRGAELIPALEANSRHSVEEPTCHRWEWSRHVENPDMFAIYELYDDAAAFEAHKQTEHFAAWKAATGSLIAKKESGQYLVAGSH